jgi:hypothetical protein
MRLFDNSAIKLEFFPSKKAKKQQQQPQQSEKPQKQQNVNERRVKDSTEQAPVMAASTFDAIQKANVAESKSAQQEKQRKRVSRSCGGFRATPYVNQVKDSPRSASYQGRASMDHQNVPPVPQGHHRDVSKEAPLQTEESERGRPATNQKKNVDHAQARDIAVQSGEPLRPRAGTNSEDEAERGRETGSQRHTAGNSQDTTRSGQSYHASESPSQKNAQDDSTQQDMRHGQSEDSRRQDPPSVARQDKPAKQNTRSEREERSQRQNPPSPVREEKSTNSPARDGHDVDSQHDPSVRPTRADIPSMGGERLTNIPKGAPHSTNHALRKPRSRVDLQRATENMARALSNSPNRGSPQRKPATGPANGTAQESSPGKTAGSKLGRTMQRNSALYSDQESAPASPGGSKSTDVGNAQRQAQASRAAPRSQPVQDTTSSGGKGQPGSQKPNENGSGRTNNSSSASENAQPPAKHGQKSDTHAAVSHETQTNAHSNSKEEQNKSSNKEASKPHALSNQTTSNNSSNNNRQMNAGNTSQNNGTASGDQEQTAYINGSSQLRTSYEVGNVQKSTGRNRRKRSKTNKSKTSSASKTSQHAGNSTDGSPNTTNTQQNNNRGARNETNGSNANNQSTSKTAGSTPDRSGNSYKATNNGTTSNSDTSGQAKSNVRTNANGNGNGNAVSSKQSQPDGVKSNTQASTSTATTRQENSTAGTGNGKQQRNDEPITQTISNGSETRDFASAQSPRGAKKSPKKDVSNSGAKGSRNQYVDASNSTNSPLKIGTFARGKKDPRVAGKGRVAESGAVMASHGTDAPRHRGKKRMSKLGQQATIHESPQQGRQSSERKAGGQNEDVKVVVWDGDKEEESNKNRRSDSVHTDERTYADAAVDTVNSAATAIGNAVSFCPHYPSFVSWLRY